MHLENQSDTIYGLIIKDMNRRKFIKQTVICTGSLSLGLNAESITSKESLKGVRDFLYSVANKDGSFRPGTDPEYKGTSDTGLSGIAVAAYATILSGTFGWTLPYPDKTKEFFISPGGWIGTDWLPENEEKPEK